MKVEQLDETAVAKAADKKEESSSIFSNLPENITDLVLDESDGPEEIELKVKSPNNIAMSGEQEQVAPSFTKVYSIMGGEDDDEYYTFYAPSCTPAGQDAFKEWKIVIADAFKRGVVHQEVLGEAVEVSYRTPSVTRVLEFPLAQGVLIKEHGIEEIGWLNKSMDQAQSEIKDLVILRYNQIVPSLINKMNVMDQQLKQVKQEGQKRKTQQDNGDLITL